MLHSAIRLGALVNVGHGCVLLLVLVPALALQQRFSVLVHLELGDGQ